MHILDKGEAAIAAFLKQTGMSREELERERLRDEQLPHTSPPKDVPEHTKAKMGAHFEFDVLDIDPS